MTTRAIMKRTVLFCLAVMAGLLFSAGRTCAEDAAPADWRLGTWVGTLQRNNGTIVMVTLTANPQKTDRATIKFSQPWDCAIDLYVTSQDDKAVSFGVKGTNGGRCDYYIEGSAQLQQMRSSDMLTLIFNGRSDSDKLKTYLKKSNAAPKAAPQPLKTQTPRKEKAK